MSTPTEFPSEMSDGKMANIGIFGNELPTVRTKWTRAGRKRVRQGIADHFLALAEAGALTDSLKEALRVEYAKAGGEPDELGASGSLG